MPDRVDEGEAGSPYSNHELYEDYNNYRIKSKLEVNKNHYWLYKKYLSLRLLGVFIVGFRIKYPISYGCMIYIDIFFENNYNILKIQ